MNLEKTEVMWVGKKIEYLNIRLLVCMSWRLWLCQTATLQTTGIENRPSQVTSIEIFPWSRRLEPNTIDSVLPKWRES